MKITNKISLILVGMLLSLLTIQCSNDEGLYQELFDDPIVFSSLDEVQDSLTKNDTINFEILSNESDTTLIGLGGIRLTFPAGCIGGGNPSSAVPPFSVKLIEVFKRFQMISHSIQTFEGQNTLVSGGMFWLEVRDANNNIMSLNGVRADVPYKTDASGFENSMLYFTGTTQTSPAGPIISWGPTQTEIGFDASAGDNGEFTIWNILGGWSNCDAYMNIAGSDATQFTAKVTNVADYSNTKIFMTLDNLTTVAALTTLEGDKLKTYEASIPMGASGKIIAISLVDNVLSFAKQDITISGDDHFDLTVAPGTLEELQALLETID
jgi:hypothetical protein